MREVLGVSERRACRTLGQHRSTQRKIPCGLPDEERLTEDIIALTRDYGRYGIVGDSFPVLSQILLVPAAHCVVVQKQNLCNLGT